jgi:N-acetylneuraminic acid mutarotase
MNPLIPLKKAIPRFGFSSPSAFNLVLTSAGTACLIATGTVLAFLRPEVAVKVSDRTLTFTQRVAYQHAIEDVYWRHRIWPKENPGPKPSLNAVMSQAQLENKVSDYLHKSQALEDYWQRPLTTEQLQAEMDRMAQHTKQPDVLRELFVALGSDPFVIAECLARPLLSERLLTNRYAYAPRIYGQQRQPADADLRRCKDVVATDDDYTLPTISEGAGCTGDTWTATNIINAPDARTAHTAVWTGSEMIVWGGQCCCTPPICLLFNTGGRYDPATDTWTATSTTNAPTARAGHTAVWTGTEMIIWGAGLDTGGRYNPGNDSWTATSTANAPEAREHYTAVWTGTEMIVWGGQGQFPFILNTGGRYNPSTDSWTATSITNAPDHRYYHTAIWTGSEMIVWGGFNQVNPVGSTNTGGKYNPGTDSWLATSTTNAPAARGLHTAVWTSTDTEMIVWGGNDGFNGLFNTGGRYNPGTDSWLATSTTNAPAARQAHTAVWTGSEMIVWGGLDFFSGFFNSGGKYSPGADSWAATSTTNAPDAREHHTAVWTGSEMIVWGGSGNLGVLNTGGRYCAESGPTPTPTATATASATETPRVTPTPRSRPTPAPRP